MDLKVIDHLMRFGCYSREVSQWAPQLPTKGRTATPTKKQAKKCVYRIFRGFRLPHQEASRIVHYDADKLVVSILKPAHFEPNAATHILTDAQKEIWDTDPVQPSIQTVIVSLWWRWSSYQNLSLSWCVLKITQLFPGLQPVQDD